MRHRIAVALALGGAGMVVASFFLPTDFAWNGLNTFKSCIATSHYASGTAARLVWLGFAAAIIYPYAWAMAAGCAVVMEWRGARKVAWRIPAIVTVAGGALVAILGISLVLMGETWPDPPVQWIAAVGAAVQIAVLWTWAARRSTARRLAAIVLTGGLPLFALQACLAVASWRYGSDVAGFVLGAAGLATLLLAAAIPIAVGGTVSDRGGEG